MKEEPKSIESFLSTVGKDPTRKLEEHDPEFIKIPWVRDLNSLKKMPVISESLYKKIKKYLQ